MYLITPKIKPNTTDEELRAIPDSELLKAEEFFEKGNLADITTMSVAAGTLQFPETSATIEFTDYESKIASSFRNEDGERIFITVDGGMINVTALVDALKEAVHNARV